MASQYDPAGCIKVFRKTDPTNGLVNILLCRVDKKPLKKRLREYKEGTLDNPIHLARAVRHIFAHGYLSPYDGGEKDVGGSAEVTVSACNILSKFLMTVMNGEFSRIVTAYQKRQEREDREKKMPRVVHTKFGLDA